jgi:prefoldin subunit 5
MYPRLDYLDQRIAELKHTIAVMRGNLQHYVEQAEQLLAATTATG